MVPAYAGRDARALLDSQARAPGNRAIGSPVFAFPKPRQIRTAPMTKTAEGLRARRTQSRNHFRRHRHDQGARRAAHRHERLRNSASTKSPTSSGTRRREIGFFQLVNHGIPQAQIDEAFEMTARFFDLPHDVEGEDAAAERHQCRLGIQEPGAALDRHRRQQGKLSDHAAAHGEALAGRRRTCRASRP